MSVIYGFHAVEAVLNAEPESVEHLLLLRTRQDKRLQQMRKLAEEKGITCELLPIEELTRVVGVENHQGVVAQVREPQVNKGYSEQAFYQSLQGNLPQNLLLLVLDQVTDPHNLGACLRSADAAGVAAIFIPKHGSVKITPVVEKVASGATRSVPVIVVNNLNTALERLKALGVWTVGLAGEAQAELYDIDMTGPTAIVMGAEGAGLRRLVKENCDFLAKIPMQGLVSSLNVSVAAGVALYEAVRQRRQGQ